MDDVIVADIDRRVRTAVEDDDIARLHVGWIDRITGRCLCRRRPRNVDARHVVSQLYKAGAVHSAHRVAGRSASRIPMGFAGGNAVAVKDLCLAIDLGSRIGIHHAILVKIIRVAVDMTPALVDITVFIEVIDLFSQTDHLRL